jgi:hypothetical protein
VVETSLQEIFSGDIPRIENMVIVLDQLTEVDESDVLGHSAQSLVKSLVGFNLLPNIIKMLEKEFSPPVTFVFIVRAEDGFRVEYGDLPERFKGTFPLEYQVSFKEKDLPRDNNRVLNQAMRIKELDGKLKGKVGFNAWAMSGTLWARVRGLNNMVDSLG